MATPLSNAALTLDSACSAGYTQAGDDTSGDQYTWRLCTKAETGGTLSDLLLIGQYPVASCSEVTCSGGWTDAGYVYYSQAQICYRLCKRWGGSPLAEAKLVTECASGVPSCSAGYKSRGGGWNAKGCGGSGYGVALCIKDIPCNNNGVCGSGETAAGCAFDCAPCNDTKRNSISSCQGDPLVSASQCRWCGVPNSPDDVPYDLPGQKILSSGMTCVNITNDPFNCGACGFSTGSPLPFGSDNKGVCYGFKPFCANSLCVDVATAGSSTSSGYLQAYISSHADDPKLNPYYQPYTVSKDALTGWKASIDIAGFTGTFLETEIDVEEAACLAGGGSFTPGLGCCGNMKCRAEVKKANGENGRKDNCHINRLCDGTSWHDDAYRNANGEVFLTTDCLNPYPVADINGEYFKCIDSDAYSQFAKDQINDKFACVPSDVPDNIGVGVSNEHGNMWGVAFTYVCPKDYYWYSDSASTDEDPCRLHGFIPGEGYLVCQAGAGAFGFAGVVNAGSGYMTNNLFTGWNGGSDDRPYCPAPIFQWKATNGQVVSPKNNAFIPCPGKLNVSIGEGISGVLAYGSLQGKDVTGVFCSDDPAQSSSSALGFMGYFKGNGTIMGNVSGREYACITDSSSTVPVGASKAKVAVCCGLQGCDGIPGNIGAGGVKMKVGDALNVTATTTLYCLADGTWSEDLDYTYTQDTCARKFSATGNYCCSEADDTRTWINESYNDPGSSKGACFKGQQQNNDFLLRYKLKNSTLVIQNNVMIYNGSFMGCGFNITSFTAEMDLNNQTLCDMSRPLSQQCVQSIEDWPDPGANFAVDSPFRTMAPLIKGVDYCTMLNTTSFGDFYCAYNQSWTSSGGENLSHKSEVPDDLLLFMQNLISQNNLSKANCCLPNECWDPSKGECIPGQGATQYHRINESTAYQCLQGVWVSMAEAKKTPDGCYIGICPNVTQCFYNQLGDRQQNNNITPDANPQCLADGQYIKDNLCMNGSWASRTKMLAQKLVSLVGDNEDFTLMCGPPSVVLNNFRQNLGDSNNFCTLDMGGQRIIGTTLNQPLINATTHMDFLTALEQNFLNLSYKDMNVIFSHTCTAQTSNFDKCIDISDSNQDYLTLYYDGNYQMVLMSNTDINGLTPNLGDRICNITPSWLQWLCPSPPELEKNLKDVQLFQKLYAANFSSKSVFGVAEQTCDPANLKKTSFYTFNYTGFTNVDLGYMINQLEASNTTITSNNVLVLNPKNNKDPWAPMTLLRNPGQQ